MVAVGSDYHLLYLQKTETEKRTKQPHESLMFIVTLFNGLFIYFTVSVGLVLRKHRTFRHRVFVSQQSQCTVHTVTLVPSSVNHPFSSVSTITGRLPEIVFIFDRVL